LEAIQQRLRGQGLKPFPMPSAIDFGAAGRCQRCANCDAMPCKIDAKGDAEVRLIRPALAKPNIELRSNARVDRLVTDKTGRRVAKTRSPMPQMQMRQMPQEIWLPATMRPRWQSFSSRRT
jgi:choline dehydrogenase-like flavoprotein